MCVKHRTPDAIATTAWIYPQPPRVLLCIRHQQASSDPRHTTPLGIRPLPELAHTHRRLARAVSAAPALTWAATITTRWYDHQQHLATRWQTRLAALTAANPHTCDGPASPTLTCRSLVTYPETLTLAQALARLPHRTLTRTQQARFLHDLAQQLELPHLTPATHDPLLTRLNSC